MAHRLNAGGLACFDVRGWPSVNRRQSLQNILQIPILVDSKFAQVLPWNVAFWAFKILATGREALLRIVAHKGSENGVASPNHAIARRHFQT